MTAINSAAVGQIPPAEKRLQTQLQPGPSSPLAALRRRLRPVAIALLVPTLWLATTLPAQSPMGAEAYAGEDDKDRKSVV